MKLSPTITADHLFSDDEIEAATKIISKHSIEEIDRGQNYNNSGFGVGKDYGKLIANWYDMNFDDLLDLREIILPKLTKTIGHDLIVQDIHMLISHRPYMLHTDVNSVRGPRKEFKNCEPEYTIIIPVETCDSYTIVFNEAHELSNNFETFKKEYTGTLDLKLDKKFVLERLTHLHPKDLLYLTLNSVQPWNKGSMFAVDRRYFHCSDNFLKNNVTAKKSMVIRTMRKVS